MLPMMFSEVLFNRWLVDDPYSNSPAEMTAAKHEKNTSPCRPDSESRMSHAQFTGKSKCV